MLVKSLLLCEMCQRFFAHISGAPKLLSRLLCTHLLQPACFKTWYPDVADYYLALQSRLRVRGSVDHQLRNQVFPGSPFGATTLNMGPGAATVPHRDSKNLVGGLCADAVLGDFDSKTSGHLVLHDLKLIIELKHGDVIFIPSAAILHSNLPVKPKTTRCSIIQYTSAQSFSHFWPPNSKHLGEQRWRESRQMLGKASAIRETKGRLSLRTMDVPALIATGELALLPRPSSCS